MDKNKKNQNGNHFINFLLVIFSLIFLVSGGILLYDYVIAPQINESEVNELREVCNSEDDTVKEPVNRWNTIKEKNDEIVAWIKIDDTKIDYPVVQNKSDEEKYLRKDLDGNYNPNGCIFASGNSDFINGKLSDVTVVYGHNMKSEKMFGQMTKYKTLDFLKTHNTIHFNIPEEDSDWTIFAVCHISTNYETNDFNPYVENYDESCFNDFVKQIRMRSFYTSNINIDYGDKILLLSTCDYEFEGERLIVVAVKNSDIDTTDIQYNTNELVMKPIEYYNKKGKTEPSKDRFEENYNKNYPTTK